MGATIPRSRTRSRSASSGFCRCADVRDHGGRDGRAGGRKGSRPWPWGDRGRLCPHRRPAHRREHEPGAVARPRARGCLWRALDLLAGPGHRHDGCGLGLWLAQARRIAPTALGPGTAGRRGPPGSRHRNDCGCPYAQRLADSICIESVLPTALTGAEKARCARYESSRSAWRTTLTSSASTWRPAPDSSGGTRSRSGTLISLAPRDRGTAPSIPGCRPAQGPDWRARCVLLDLTEVPPI